MKKLLIIILLGAAYWHWNQGQLPFLAKPAAVDSSGSPVTWIFTFAGCGHACSDAIKELKNRGVPFEEKSINPNNSQDANMKLWQDHRKGDSFPLIVAGNNSFSGFSVPEIATLLGKTFGNNYLTRDEQRFFKKHFNEDGSPRIVLYGTGWCGYCTKLRKEFNGNQVDFVDIDVDRAADKTLLCKTMGIAGYPATWVGYTRVKNGSDYAAVMALANRK